MHIMQISPNFNNINNSNRENGSNTRPVSFTSAPESQLFVPVKKHYNKFTDAIARQLAKIVDTKMTQRVIEYTKKYPRFKNNYVTHLAVIGSIVLSGFYVTKTLNNEKLDEQKRRTLAINQGIVWGISTVMNYTFNKLTDKKLKEFLNKFKEMNKDLDADKLSKYENGIKIAKAIMVIDIVYRFIAPVVVTPIANHIGNKIQEKKDAELMRKQNA